MLNTIILVENLKKKNIYNSFNETVEAIIFYSETHPMV